MEIVRLTDEKTKVRIYEARLDDGTIVQGPSVSEATGHVNRRELIDWFKRKDLVEQTQVSGDAASKGTAIHSALERIARTGERGEVSESIRPAVEQYERYAEQVNLKTESSERYIFSLTYGYGGTYDAVGEINGQKCLIDFKTGRYSNKDLWKTEAYRRAYIEMGGDPDIGVTLLYLDKTGKKKPKVYTVQHHDYCFKMFLSCLATWKGLYFNDLKRADWNLEWLLEDPVEKFLAQSK